MTRIVLYLGTAILAACTTPDLGPGIGEATRLLAATDRELRPVLSPLAAAELAAAEEAAMRRGDLVLGFEGDSDPYAARDEGKVLSECRLVEHARPLDGPVNATQTLLALDTLGAYYAALAALAASNAPDEIAARSAALIDGLNGLSKDLGSGAFAGLGARRDLIGRSSGFVANQARTAAIRKVVRKADPVIGDLTALAVAWLDELPGGVPEAQAAFVDARGRLLEATEARNLAAQRDATQSLRKAHAALLKAEAASPANPLLMLRKLHGDLARRLSRPGSADDFLKTLAEIRAISDLARKGG